MQNRRNQTQLWKILEETLCELDFTSNDIEKVKKDLANLISSQTATDLLEQLSLNSARELNDMVKDKPAKEQENIIADYLKKSFLSEDIEKQVAASTQTIIKDYFDYLLSKINNNRKAKLLQSIVE